MKGGTRNCQHNGCAPSEGSRAAPINALHLMIEERQELGVLAVIASCPCGFIAQLAVLGLGAAYEVKDLTVSRRWVYCLVIASHLAQTLNHDLTPGS